MERTKSEATSRAEFGNAAQAMHSRLRTWRQAHPAATFDEIAEQVRMERLVLMGGLLGELATVASDEPFVAVCPECGGPLQHKGKKKRAVLHREGDVQLTRDHYYCYYCPVCQAGFFPPGPQAGAE